MKKIFLYIFIFAVNINPALGERVSAKDYNPPFELCGVVKEVNEDSLKVYVPKIDKQITVIALPGVLVIDRVDKADASCSIKDIRIEDLVIIKGAVERDSLLSKEISFLSMSPKSENNKLK